MAGSRNRKSLTDAERERAATGPHDQAVDDEPDEEVEVAA